MKKTILRATYATLAVLSAAALAMPSALAADTESAPPQSGPDRIVYIDGPAPSLVRDSTLAVQTASDGTEMRVAPAKDFPVTPEVGETVRVVYTDAVTDVVGVARACTESRTAALPYLQAGKAWVITEYQRSTGCSGNAGAAGILFWGWWGGWVEKARNSTTVHPDGYAVSFGTPWTCLNSSSTVWKGIALMNGETEGPQTTLSCGG